MILSLLGIKGEKSQQQPTKLQKIVDVLCVLIVCLGFGYLAALQGFDSIPLNADALAPFEEAKSLISTPHTHLFNIHVSRIASIFPDLTINVLLQRIRPKAGFLEIFSLYAWCTSFLFLLLTTLLINEIKKGEQTLTADAIKTSLITVGLLNISHQFNIAYSHFMTPVHHGGNILNTLLLLTLSLKILRKPNKAITNVLFVGLTALATMSNKISIFTAILPIFILYIFYLKGRSRRNQIVGLILGALAGVVIDVFFNKQCASPEFNLWGTFSAFQQYFQLSWITSASALLATASLFYVHRDRSTTPDLPLQTSAGLTAVSLSSLSYFIYLPMLTSGGEAPLRYICIAYALIVVFFVVYINQINRKLNATILIVLIVATAITFQSEDRPELYLDTHQSLKQSLLDRSERIEPAWNDAAKFIKAMGYSSYLGLGDYWMTGATLATNSKLQLVPIHRSGSPDFWGATPKDIWHYIKPLNKDKVYLISDNETFNQRFERQYGMPETTWKHDNVKRRFIKQDNDANVKALTYNNPVLYTNIKQNSNNVWNYRLAKKSYDKQEPEAGLKILIYDNSNIYTKIRKESAKFKRQCNNNCKASIFKYQKRIDPQIRAR